MKSKDNKDKLWIYHDPSVRLPYYFIESNAFKRASHAGKLLYILMRMSILQTNFNPARVAFGPADAEPWMNRKTYYPALKSITGLGIIREVEPGKHGRKAVYDLSTRNWIDVDPKPERKPRRAKPVKG